MRVRFKNAWFTPHGFYEKGSVHTLPDSLASKLPSTVIILVPPAAVAQHSEPAKAASVLGAFRTAGASVKPTRLADLDTLRQTSEAVESAKAEDGPTLADRRKALAEQIAAEEQNWVPRDTNAGRARKK